MKKVFFFLKSVQLGLESNSKLGKVFERCMLYFEIQDKGERTLVRVVMQPNSLFT